ncbi:MAG: cytidylate kinase-like family protein [Deltaproteobacteria bacterium]|nr:cytidylate kinase-like family protein [Deltaproteobacteria bacterium]
MSVITISRQFGAGGLTLGQLVSKQLGYTFFDNEILQMVAKKARVSTHWVESMEKEAGGKFQRFVSQLVPQRLVDRILDDQRGYLDEEIYVDLLHEIVRKIADEGDAVILGRGSQYILKDDARARHLLLVADKDYRIQFIKEKYDVTDRHAVNSVNMEDKRRTNLYRRFGKEDYDSPSHYHLILNMNRINLNRACDLICKLV